jgi:type VI protein secretion system component VasK
MTNMNAIEFMKTVDHAASMSDRGLCLAAFGLLLVLCGVVMRWQARQVRSLATEQKLLRKTHGAALETITRKQSETVRTLIACLVEKQRGSRGMRLRVGSYPKAKKRRLTRAGR